MLRLLKPGDLFAASDWLKGEDAENEAVMMQAGFDDVSRLDRQAW